MLLNDILLEYLDLVITNITIDEDIIFINVYFQFKIN